MQQPDGALWPAASHQPGAAVQPGVCYSGLQTVLHRGKTCIAAALQVCGNFALQQPFAAHTGLNSRAGNTLDMQTALATEKLSPLILATS